MTTIISIVALLLVAAPAWAFDAEQTFKKGTFVLSGEGAYGWQSNLEHKRAATYVEFYDAGVRFSLLPLDTIARSSFLYGALEVGEINSTLAFLVFGGLGASIFVSNKTALYAGYRYQHVSNGNTSQPNRGFESNVGVAGISFFFP